MKIKRYQKERHEKLVNSWFEARKFPAPNPNNLPPLGAVVYDDFVPVCAGFLFRTDAGIAVIGHLVSDPDIEGSVRHAALNFLIDDLVACAEAHDYSMVCCSTNLPELMSRFESKGFKRTDENVVHFGRIL